MTEAPQLQDPRNAVERAKAELDPHHPRNAVERAKAELDPLDIRPRIERYARDGYASIDPDDLKIRFRWWGLYTQRPEGSGYFMMRIRVAGGALTSEQLETIGRIAKLRCRDVADVTDRQSTQLHWVVIQDVPAIWDELANVGLETGQTCGDTVRNILGCPVAGVDAGEVFDAGPDLAAADARLTHTKEFTNLPRKYKLSISGCRDHCAMHEINDGGLVGVAHPDGRLGYDVWVGGGLSSSPRFAERLGVFVPREQATEFLVALTSLFRDHGGRDKRTRARLKFLVGAWGVDRLRKVLQDHYLGRPLEDGPEAPPSSTVHRDHVGVYRQHDGRYYVGVAPLVGRTSGSQLIAVAKLARELGRGRVRLTTQQKILVLDVPKERGRGPGRRRVGRRRQLPAPPRRRSRREPRVRPAGALTGPGVGGRGRGRPPDRRLPGGPRGRREPAELAAAPARRAARRAQPTSDSGRHWLRHSPTPSTTVRTSWPGRSHTGGVRAAPTPAGVPVAIRSPGSRVVMSLR
jgi:sulfite reductase (ferredoxin)